MQNSWIDTRIQYEFRSIVKLLIHFSISFIQLASVLAILALQIILIVTQTCGYQIGVGFWSIPFLLIAPTSIWVVIWRRNSSACCIVIVTQLIATLIATSIIIINFLVLIGQNECSTSSLNMYNVPLNSSFIGIAGIFKIFNYCEIILIYKLKNNTDQIPTIFIEDFYEKDYPLLSNPMHTNTWRSWSRATSETCSELDDLFV